MVKKALVLGAALAAGAALILSHSPLPSFIGLGTAPPVLGDAPRFSLVGHDGKAFESRSLDGRPWLASFLFTSCPGPCPRLVERLKLVRQRIAPSSLPFVSFTVDPATDTPEVLAAYRRDRGIADSDGWIFATGSTAGVLAVVEKGFLTAVEKTGAAGDGGLTHGTRVALVDRNRQLRGFYALDRDEELGRLERDLGAID